MREKLIQYQESAKQQTESMADKEAKIEEMAAEMGDLQAEKEVLGSRVQTLKDANNELDKRILEQTLTKEALEREVERLSQNIAQNRSEIKL